MIMEELLNILNTLKPGANFSGNLIADHVLDSLSIAMLVGEVNDTFDVEISPLDVIPQNFETVDAIYALICRLQEKA